MNAIFKITDETLDQAREDLRRPHPFAAERVGFLLAGIAFTSPDNLFALCRSYFIVEDDDYEDAPGYGAKIGGAAMRKALQAAYKDRSALFHIHAHHGRGSPEFSRVDQKSGAEFVPGFFHTVPRMPHGMIVLSDDSATGRIWLGENDHGAYINGFIQIGARVARFGGRQ